jgi:hypothetical protein
MDGKHESQAIRRAVEALGRLKIGSGVCIREFVTDALEDEGFSPDDAEAALAAAIAAGRIAEKTSAGGVYVRWPHAEV